MTSKAQRKANRENATHSTGPTSPTGRATCALNSLKHGLSTSQLLIPGESEEEFNTLLTSLLATHQPANITETMLVQDMAKHHWLADRALRLQANAIALSLDGAPPALAILIRYHTANERAYHRAFAALNASRKTRLAEIGSASQKAPAPPPPPETVTASHIPSCDKILEMFQKGFDYNPATCQFHPLPKKKTA